MARSRYRFYSPDEVEMVRTSLELARTVVTYLKVVRAPAEVQVHARTAAKRIGRYLERILRTMDKVDNPIQPRRTRPPGMFTINQHFPSLEWQVVPITRDQGEAMLRRGEVAFHSIGEAHAARAGKAMRHVAEAV